MKNLFIFLTLIAILFSAATENTNAQTKEIEKIITDYQNNQQNNQLPSDILDEFIDFKKDNGNCVTAYIAINEARNDLSPPETLYGAMVMKKSIFGSSLNGKTEVLSSRNYGEGLQQFDIGQSFEMGLFIGSHKGNLLLQLSKDDKATGVNGMGIVKTSKSTLFYGTFNDGKQFITIILHKTPCH